MTLSQKHVINDFAMMQHKVSEFLYKPILEEVNGYAIPREEWTNIMKQSFFKKNYKKLWCQKYIRTIMRPVNEHRSLTSEKFQNRIDYVELSAFGIDYKQN